MLRRRFRPWTVRGDGAPLGITRAGDLAASRDRHSMKVTPTRLVSCGDRAALSKLGDERESDETSADQPLGHVHRPAHVGAEPVGTVEDARPGVGPLTVFPSSSTVFGQPLRAISPVPPLRTHGDAVHLEPVEIDPALPGIPDWRFEALTPMAATSSS